MEILFVGVFCAALRGQERREECARRRELVWETIILCVQTTGPGAPQFWKHGTQPHRPGDWASI
eukprot:6595948-Prymnesium_polylepis.1